MVTLRQLLAKLDVLAAEEPLADIHSHYGHEDHRPELQPFLLQTGCQDQYTYDSYAYGTNFEANLDANHNANQPRSPSPLRLRMDQLELPGMPS